MDKAVLKSLGGRIRARRKAFAWSQEELAERADIDRTYISGVERGVRNLTGRRRDEAGPAGDHLGMR